MRFDINYLREIKSGETVEIRTAPIPGADIPDMPTVTAAAAYEGRRQDEDQAVFRAELRFG